MLVPEREGRISDYGSINGTEAMSIAVIKLRYKEDVHEMKNISLLSTVSDFKSQVADCTGIPVERQRLVIGGKRMEPNTLALQDFKLRENDNIYLFPLPLQQAAAFTPSANNSSAQQVQRWINVPQITLAARELELCCQELVAVSDFFVVMDALYFMGAENFGYDTFYSLVVLGDFLVSVLSSNLSHRGLSITPATLPMFVHKVKAMCIVCCVYRMVWSVSYPFYAQYLSELALQKGQPKPFLAIMYEDKTALFFLISVVCFFSVGSWIRYVNVASQLQEALAQHAVSWDDTLPLLQRV